jgi:hypothetical protein
LTLIDLSGDGTLKFLFPRFKEDSPQVNEGTFWIRLRAGEPFGADHLIAVVSDQRLYGLEASLSALSDRKAAGQLPEILQDALRSPGGARLGFAALFTAKR